MAGCAWPCAAFVQGSKLVPALGSEGVLWCLCFLLSFESIFSLSLCVCACNVQHICSTLVLRCHAALVHWVQLVPPSHIPLGYDSCGLSAAAAAAMCLDSMHVTVSTGCSSNSAVATSEPSVVLIMILCCVPLLPTHTLRARLHVRTVLCGF